MITPTLILLIHLHSTSAMGLLFFGKCILHILLGPIKVGTKTIYNKYF